MAIAEETQKYVRMRYRSTAHSTPEQKRRILSILHDETLLSKNALMAAIGPEEFEDIKITAERRKAMRWEHSLANKYSAEIEYLYNKGWADVTIARALQISDINIKKWRNHFGLDSNHKNFKLAWFFKQLHNNGKSIQEIAHQFDVKPEYINILVNTKEN